MDLLLYNYDGYKETVNKSLPTATTVQGKFRGRNSMLTPVVTLKQTDARNFNYAYIPILNRYYFVTGVEILDNNLCELSLSVDVLKTYENEILTATATVETSEDGNPYLSTRNDVYDRQPVFEKVDFPNTGLLNREGTIIMVTIKGDNNGI